MPRTHGRALWLSLTVLGPLALGVLAGAAAAPPARGPARPAAPSEPTPSAGAQASPTAPPARKVIAYYFHGNVRCRTCRKIEASAADAIQRRFAAELQAGRLEWRPTNVDQPANEHFIHDYQLVTRSLVLVEIRDGKQVRWKNLDQVWELVSDEIRFGQYVQREVRDFLAGV